MFTKICITKMFVTFSMKFLQKRKKIAYKRLHKYIKKLRKPKSQHSDWTKFYRGGKIHGEYHLLPIKHTSQQVNFDRLSL